MTPLQVLMKWGDAFSLEAHLKQILQDTWESCVTELCLIPASCILPLLPCGCFGFVKDKLGGGIVFVLLDVHMQAVFTGVRSLVHA